jgi:hypothetical protein
MADSVKTLSEVLVVNRHQTAIGASRISVETQVTDGISQGERTVLIKTKKIEKLIEHLKGIQETQFTGYIKINFSQGNIGRVERFEEILKS